MKANLKGFSVKHRVFLIKNYYQFTGDFLCVKTKYEDNYRDSENVPEFSYDVLMEIVNLFERTGSVMDCPAKPPETSNQQIERIFVKEENPLGMIEEQDSLRTNPKRKMAHSAGDMDDDEDMAWQDEDDYFSRPQKTPRMSSDMRSEVGSGIKLTIPMKKSKPNTQFSLNRENAKEFLSNLNFSCTSHTSDSFPDIGIQETSSQGQEGQDSNKEDALLFTLDPSYDKKLDGISNKIDKVLRLLKGNVYRTSTYLPGILDSGMDLNVNFPAASKEDLETLNNNLAKKDYRAAFVKEMSKINGYTGMGEGLKAAFRLCDYMFDRVLLNHYTWTGNSRNNAKDRFSRFSNIIDTFGEIIMLADNRFSTAHNEDFFKTKILKHSEARCKKKISSQGDLKTESTFTL